MKRTSPVFAGVLAQQQGAPPPAATGTDVPTSYFGPPPSEIDRQLVGPVQLLRSGKLDRKRGTIRLPLYLGHMRDGRNVWYILTDTTDRDNAEALGLNHSAKLAYSQVGRAVREGELDREAGLVFDAGAVDFPSRAHAARRAAVQAVSPGGCRPRLHRRRRIHSTCADRERGRAHLQRSGRRLRQERRRDPRLPP